MSTPSPACACGNPVAMWRGSRTGLRVYSCEDCHEKYQSGNLTIPTPPPNPSETPLVDTEKANVLNAAEYFEKSPARLGDKWQHVVPADFARTLERRATLAERRCGELERALKFIREEIGHEIVEGDFPDFTIGEYIDRALTPKPEPKGETE